jgi:hypothetical protein
MSRRFSASNDEVRYPIQAGSNFSGAWSMAVLLKRASATLQWQAVIGHHDSSGAYQAGFEISGQPNPQDHVVAAFNASTTAYGTTRAQSSDGWVILGVSKAAGSGVAPRAHIYKAGAWTHEAVSTTLADAATQAGGSIRLGELADVDDFDGWIAADAGWASDIGDAGFVALTANLNIADWVAHATPPAYVHQHNQATAGEDILDLMGNGHVATGTITGTTDAVGIAGTTMDPANEPSGWTYFGASGLVIPVRRRGPNRRFLRAGPLAQVERRSDAPASTAAPQTITAGGAAFSLTSGGSDPAPQPVSITAGGAAFTTAVGGATPTSVISITVGGASFAFAGGGATPAPQPVSVSAGGAAVAFTGAGATPAPQPVSVTAGGASFAFTGGRATPAPQPVSITAGGASFQLAAGGGTPVSSISIAVGGAAFAFTGGGATPQSLAVTVAVGGAAFALTAAGATPAPQPVSTTAGGASFRFTGGGSTPSPQPISITARGAAFAFTGGGAGAQILVGQTLSIAGAAFRWAAGGARAIIAIPGRAEAGGASQALEAAPAGNATIEVSGSSTGAEVS